MDGLLPRQGAACVGEVALYVQQRVVCAPALLLWLVLTN